MSAYSYTLTPRQEGGHTIQPITPEGYPLPPITTLLDQAQATVLAEKHIKKLTNDYGAKTAWEQGKVLK